MHEGCVAAHGKNARAANRKLDARVSALAEVTSFGPASGPYVELDQVGRVVWRRIDD